MGLETAAIIAIGGLATSAAGTTGSFIQAGKQRRAAAKAREEASKAFQDARKRLEINYYKGLGIQKEPYELEREALLAAGAQSIEAAKESERGAAAAAGRVQMAQQEGQAQVRTAMGKEMQALDELVAGEESRLAGAQADLSLAEATGAQAAAAYSTNAANQSMAAGMAGLQEMGQQMQNLIPLYPNQGAEKKDRGLPANIEASRLGAPMAPALATTMAPRTGVSPAGFTYPVQQTPNYFDYRSLYPATNFTPLTPYGQNDFLFGNP